MAQARRAVHGAGIWPERLHGRVGPRPPRQESRTPDGTQCVHCHRSFRSLCSELNLLNLTGWSRAEPILRERLLKARHDTRFRDVARRWAKERFWRVGHRPIFKHILPSTESVLSPDITRLLPLVQQLVRDDSGAFSGDQFYTVNRDVILDAVEAAFRDRLVAMIRIIAAAWTELRKAQADGASCPEDQRLRDGAIEALACTDVALPRLPAWIPRDPDFESINATTEQMARFIEFHDLAVFTCQKCGNLFGGMDAAKHVMYGWGDCVAHPTRSLDEWLPVGGSGGRGITTDVRSLLRGLKLRELADSVDLVCSDPQLEERAELCEVDMSDADKYVVLFECRCDCQPAPTTKLFGRVVRSLAYTRRIRAMY